MCRSKRPCCLCINQPVCLCVNHSYIFIESLTTIYCNFSASLCFSLFFCRETRAAQGRGWVTPSSACLLTTEMSPGACKHNDSPSLSLYADRDPQEPAVGWQLKARKAPQYVLTSLVCKWTHVSCVMHLLAAFLPTGCLRTTGSLRSWRANRTTGY